MGHWVWNESMWKKVSNNLHFLYLLWLILLCYGNSIDIRGLLAVAFTERERIKIIFLLWLWFRCIIFECKEVYLLRQEGIAFSTCIRVTSQQIIQIELACTLLLLFLLPFISSFEVELEIIIFISWFLLLLRCFILFYWGSTV